MDNAPLYASASFSKVPGTLSLSADGLLRWKPSSAGTSVAPLEVRDRDLKGLQASKPGAARVALRLEAAPGKSISGNNVALFIFNADEQTALADREKFKVRLAAAIAAAKADAQQTDPPASGDVPPVKLRGQVLLANPSLLALHKQVVGAGIVSDDDFWAHPARLALLQSEKSRMEQKQGRRGQLADPRPTQNEAGEMKLNITPQLIRELFEQYPVLARAYKENVPMRLDESTFWARYFQSKLYHQLRTSIRSEASKQTLQPDDIFDKYLVQEDDDLVPRRAYNPHDRLLDLASTEEDHGETGNLNYWTMRPGYDRRTLPLVRRFNQHSESILTSSLGETPQEDRSRRKTGGVGDEYKHAEYHQPSGSHYYDEIEIDDLNEHTMTNGRLLNIYEQQAYFEIGARADTQDAHAGEHLTPARIDAFAHNLEGWKLNLSSFSARGRHMRAALVDMLDNMDQRKHGRGETALSELPPNVVRDLLACHAATGEFLRQFWQQLAPSWEPNRASPEERAKRAKIMAAELVKTHGKVRDIALDADDALPGRGRSIVEEAMSGTLAAVEKVLSNVSASIV
ncbi:RNA polymerase II transcription factor B subunit 1 [Malassezia cuniculi]|uniref:RNA polymerase II transcription factor B subunit 1 n=1 Tax=Malassezia cuniculi TaxID=948313 RepID=A0AAF0EPN6_9BASI|nr:RNA polymerase II transcription factor B subunit 1 [Malassezia cuniculi]